jgi:hypothetical protein
VSEATGEIRGVRGRKKEVVYWHNMREQIPLFFEAHYAREKRNVEYGRLVFNHFKSIVPQLGRSHEVFVNFVAEVIASSDPVLPVPSGA